MQPYPSRLNAPSRRHLILAGAVATLMSVSPSARAAQFIYTPGNGFTDLWSAGTGWSGIPVSAVDTRLTFVGTNTDVFADGLANTNTNDIADQFLLNILDLQGTGLVTTAATVQIAGTFPSTGVTLIANGATTPVVNLNAVAGAGLTYDVQPTLTLANNTLFTGAGTANFNFSGGLSGSGVTLSKSGASILSMGGASALGLLDLGINNAGGSVSLLSGSALAIGNGTGNLRIGVSGIATAASGTLDATAAASFTANVVNVQIGHTGNNNVVAQGILNLAAFNDITATGSFTMGHTGGAQNNVTSAMTTPAGSTTVIRTPTFIIGGSKSRGTFTLGAGATFDLTGTGALSPTTGRTSFGVSNMAAGGGGGTYSGTVDLSGGVFRGNLNGLFIGNNNTASSSSAATGILTLSADALNRLDIVGAGSVVVVGRQQVSTASGVATGTLTIGNLDPTSSVTTTTAGATAILVGSALTAGKAVGTLNLNGGTLGINTTGAAIGGTALGTSTVNFNGTTLRALNNSTGWITAITNANVGAGGAKFDTNNFTIAIAQALNHDALLGATEDGGLTKSGNGVLTLSGMNTFTGPITISGGTLHAAKTASLPGYLTPGHINVLFGSIGLNVGGAGEFEVSDIDLIRTNAVFSSTHGVAIDTSNAGGTVTYASSFGTLYNLAKLGINTLVLDTGATTVGALSIGINNNGGTVQGVAGTSFSVGSGSLDNLNIGVTNTPTAASGVLNVSASGSFAANVGSILLGSAGNNSVTGQGTLNLPAENVITAANLITVGTSGGAFNSPVSAITVEGGGNTFVQTPNLTVGGTKSRGTLTIGAGAIFELGGTFGGRTTLSIGRSAVEGGTGNWSGVADFSGGVFKGTLGNVVIGSTDAGSGGWTEDGTLTLSADAANHVDIAGFGTAVIVGNWISGGAVTTGGLVAATGTWTIGNLDATSSITSLDNGTGILLASGGAAGAQRAAGNLNLNGGTLTITTSGIAISGDAFNPSNVSTVRFNGTQLRAGASSTNWISNLTNAVVSTGGARVDTAGFDIIIPQVLSHDSNLPGADGGFSKTGEGTLTLTGVNTYDGPTIVNEGTLLVHGSISASNVNVLGGVLGGSGGTTGNVTVSALGTIAPGASIGALIIGTLTFSGAGTFALEIDTTTVSSDVLSISGPLTLGGASPNLTITDLGGDMVLALDTKLTFINYIGAWDNQVFQFGGAPVADGGVIAVGSNLFAIDYNDGNSVSLTVVPEPAACVSLLGGLGILLGARRQRAV